MKNKGFSLYLASGLVALLAACGQTEVKPLPEEPTVEAQVLPLNLNVNTFGDLADNNPGNGLCQTFIGSCSLRAAIEETNAWPTKDKINVPAGLYVLTSGRLNITDSVSVRGAMEGTTTIDGNGEDMVFYVKDASYTDQYRLSAEFHHLTIRNGYGSAGGGIRNDGAKVLVNKSIIIGNDAFTAGGGIANYEGGIMEVRYSTIRNNGNMDTVRAGGIANGEASHLLIYKSAVHNNESNRYGGVGNSGIMNMVNSTVSHNLSRIDSSGVLNTGEANLNNVTVAFNEATIEYDNSPGSAAGLKNTGTLRIGNSIVAHNTNHFGSAQDCLGNITSMGYNLIMDDTDCTIGGDLSGNLIGQDPLLAVLGNYGGTTFTHRLANNSPARNAGNPAAPNGLGAHCEPEDQRNTSRGFGPAGRCDMGAYEVAGGPGGKVKP